jgi:hypothetical protein
MKCNRGNAPYLTLALAAMGLLVVPLLLAFGMGPPAVAAPAAYIIKVPDDYHTIQEAIDAASEGDEIWVVAGTYGENLSITEGITLTGGWDRSFETRQPGDSTIDGQGLGRVISITCPSRDTVVTVDGFTLQYGDATGLGGPPMATREVPHSSLHGSVSQPSQELADTLTPAEHANRIRARLGDMDARGEYPGGPAAYQAMLARLERLAAQAEQAQALSRPTEIQASESVDYGGGIYSWNASLHLRNSTVQFNVAGMNNDGHGGGVYVGQAAPSGVIIAHNVVKYNTASNYAGGKGGGLYLFQTPGAVVEDNWLLENAASNGGQLGVGGGLYVDDSAGVLVRGNRVEGNAAHASWDCAGLVGGGVGGGAEFRMTDDVIVTDNVFRENLAALHCASSGGGFHVYRAANVRLEGNEVVNNWGVLFQTYTGDLGGGLGIEDSDVTMLNCTVSGNQGTNAVEALDTDAQPDQLIVTNSIIWGNAGPDLACGVATCVVTYSDIGGGATWPGAGNINQNPAFVDPSSDDYRLQPGSQAIDVAPALVCPPADLHGIVRPQDGDGDTVAECDMGAHEYLPPPVVTATFAGGGIELLWTDNAPGMVYEVWRSSDPYLNPEDGNATLEDVLMPMGGQVMYADPAGVGNPDRNTFYIVRMLHTHGLDYGAANRVGEFDFGVVPGS